MLYGSMVNFGTLVKTHKPTLQDSRKALALWSKSQSQRYTKTAATRNP